MIIQTSKGYSNVTISFDQDEQQVLAWMNDNYSNLEFQAYIESFMKQRSIQMKDSIKNTVWQGLSEDTDFHTLVSSKLNIDISPVFKSKVNE